MMANDELYHYGVKGMKWGVRKDREKKSSRKPRRISTKELRSTASSSEMRNQSKSYVKKNGEIKGRLDLASDRVMNQALISIGSKILFPIIDKYAGSTVSSLFLYAGMGASLFNAVDGITDQALYRTSLKISQKSKNE